jgi:hypothetical protein
MGGVSVSVEGVTTTCFVDVEVNVCHFYYKKRATLMVQQRQCLWQKYVVNDVLLGKKKSCCESQNMLVSIEEAWLVSISGPFSGLVVGRVV